MALVLLLACTTYNFDPPQHPPHRQDEGETQAANGAPLFKSGRHADLLRTPFLCLDLDTGRAIACPEQRPDANSLSCDAAGCHGDFSFSPDEDRSSRHLRGSDGPSCYSCHEQLWSERQQ